MPEILVALGLNIKAGVVAAILGGALTSVAASGTAQVVTNLLTGQKWYAGLGSVIPTAAVMGGISGGIGYGIAYIRAHRIINGIVKNDLQNVKLTHLPKYDPTLPWQYAGEAAAWTKTVIGPRAIWEGRGETLITIVHEEMHHRLWARGWMQSAKYVEAVAQRFARMIGNLIP